jgi:hypothetical protein
MQVDAATLTRLIRDGAKLALIFADRGARQLEPAPESRVVRSGQKRGPQKLKGLINYGRRY